MKTISVRLPEQYINDIEEAAGEELIDKGSMLRKLIGNGLREYRIKKHLNPIPRAGYLCGRQQVRQELPTGQPLRN